MSSIAKLCSVDGCEALIETDGLCARHYKVWLRHGVPAEVLYRSPTIKKKTHVSTLERVCIVEGCDLPRNGTLYCKKHKALFYKLRITWQGIKQRCFDEKHGSYKRYGAKGIRMCEGWRGSFKAFYDDMGPKPSPIYSVDRIDSSGHYSCGKCRECLANGWSANCRWATPLQQARNRKAPSNASRFVGVSRSRNKWSVAIYVGTFTDEVEAAHAYNEAARLIFGEDALLNDI